MRTQLYLIKEVSAFCKLWPQGVLSPVNPEISGERLARQYVREQGSQEEFINQKKKRESELYVRNGGCLFDTY